MKGVSHEFLQTSLSFTDAADMSAFDTGGLVDGAIAYVTSTARFYYFLSSSSTAPGATVLLTANSGVAGALPGRWFRIA